MNTSPSPSSGLLRSPAATGPGCAGVVGAALALLEQCDAFIRLLPEQAYTADSATIRGGTIGKHIRHLLDHFDAILVGVEAEAAIDYDHRERDVPMELRPVAALEGIERTRRRLAGLMARPLDGPARIRVMLAADGSEAEFGTTIARELAFATHHAIHHQAMMRAIAQEHGVAPGPDFGKAPSTINHASRAGDGGPAPARGGLTG